MVRSVTQNYGIWLAGYYDDFTGARAIPDDENIPSATADYDHAKSHFGNPMNGEATLNPRYRWCFADRDRSIGSAFLSTTTNKRLSNKGVYEWVSHDIIRQNPNKWEGRAQLQYPDGHIPNRGKYGANGTAGSEGYQLISNSFDSSTRYIVATGDNDATFGRASMKNYTEANFESSNYSISGQMTSSTGNFVQRAHLAGVWTGERIVNTSEDVDDVGAPHDVFAPLTSPAKTPFLCIQSFHKQHNSAGSQVAICYDGTLNSKLNEDIFTVRLAVRALTGITGTNNGTIIPRVTLKLGSAAPAAANLDNGLATTVVSYDVDLSAYTMHPLLYDGSTTASAVDNDASWLDIDVVLDYDNNQYKVYQDGVLKQTTGSFTITPEQLYGWEITALPTASYTHASSITLFVDRAALYHPLTDHPDSREMAPINDLRMESPINKSSQLGFKVYDDKVDDDGTSTADFSHHLKNIFLSSSLSDWNILFFANDLGSARIDRPLWNGVISQVNVGQSVGGGRVISVEGIDRLSGLAKQLPMWEIGQSGLDSDEDSNPYWLHDAEGFNEIMYLGVRKLKELKPTVGFDVDDTYVERTDQRTQMGSGHPIQMYTNEDTFGPNSIWDAYDGVAVTGIGEEYNGGAVRTVMLLAGDPGWSSGAVTITNSASHNGASITPTATEDIGTNQKLYFNQSHINFTAGSGLIAYAGKYKPTWITPDIADRPEIVQTIVRAYHPAAPHNETPFYHVIFDANPGLKVGDKFFVGQYQGGTSNSDTTFTDVIHKVKTIRKSFNYFDPTVLSGDYVWLVETETLYGSGAEFGTYTSDDLTDSSDRLQWSKDTGQTSLVPSATYDTTSRAVHARWMQDLPQSLWFQYHFGQIESTPIAYGNLIATVGVNQSNVKISSTGDNDLYDDSPNSGIGQLHHPLYGYTTFIYRGKYATGNDRYLVGCEYIGRSYPTTASFEGTSIPTRVYTLNVKNDYKHIWLLWSDMRNNGSANADGATRKEEFGLLYPSSTNYKVSLSYTDQSTTEGTPDRFTELKVKDDYNIWNIDSTNDPSTNNAFSKPVNFDAAVTSGITLSENSSDTKLRVTKSSHGFSTGDYIHLFNTDLHNGTYQIEDGSDSGYMVMAAGTWKGADNGEQGGIRYAPIAGSHVDEAVYQDWESKGGAFIVIDTSPFFNLNTATNGGISGQTSGNKTDLGDYIATVEGFPMLIDNYYAEAISSYKTTGQPPFEHHPNSRRLVTTATLATNDLKERHTHIVCDDVSEFDDTGLGRITCGKGTGRDRQIAERYFSWSGKVETAIDKTTSSAADTTYYGTYDYGGSLKIGKKLVVAGENFETLGVNVGAALIFGGVVYTVSGLATTSSSNDSLLVHKLIPGAGNYDDGIQGGWLWTHLHNIPYGIPVAWGINETTGAGKTNDNSFTDISSIFSNGGGDAFSIPIQLNGVWTTSTNNIDASTTESPSAVENELAAQLSNVPYADRSIDMTMSIEGSEPDFDDITVNSSVSSQYMLRLMMKVDGYAKSPNSGSYYESDKFRLLWNSALVRQWLPPTQLYTTFDINNVPITSNMTVDGTVGNTDSYGSPLDTRNMDFGSILSRIQEGSGVGDTYKTSFCFLQGRDGRIEFRPKYNSGLALTRANINISNMKMDIEGQIDKVRVYYDDALSFVDWPATTTPFTSTAKWKVVQSPEVKSHEEALAVAKAEYETLNTPALSLLVAPRLDSADHEPMLTDGRYGYIADPQIALQGTLDYDEDSSSVPRDRHRAWTLVGTGGVPFSGMVNALDGNQKTSTDIYHRYGQSTVVAGNDVAWDDNFYWYGAKSLSYATQIVHVPKRCPLDSDTTSNELRVWVALKNGQSGTDIDNAEFIVGLTDYAFSTSSGTGGSGPTLIASKATNGEQTVTVKHSGFYEITVPQSYSSSLNSDGAKFVISFNAEYCRALLRHRCGNPAGADVLKNKHDVIGHSSFSAYNANSIFPLGVREYGEICLTFSSRAAFHGPRLHIVPDFAYTPATYVTLTDAGLNLSSEVLVIQKVMYKIRPDRIEVRLQLEKDESKAVDSVISYLFPTPPPPPAEPGYHVQNTSGPSITVGAEVDSNSTDNMPLGGTQEVTQASGTTNFGVGSAINDLSSAAYGNIRGRMDLAGDSFSHQGQFSVLGQKKPVSIPSVMKPYNDNTDLKIDAGTTTMSDEGYSLPPSGTHPSEESTVFHKASLQTIISVPSDAISEEIALSAVVSCGEGGTGGKAIVQITIECVDTGASLTRAIPVPTNTSRQNIELIPTNNLSGANTPNNRLKVTLTRRNEANDTATQDSVIFHDLQLHFRRAGMQGKSQTNEFRPYQ